MLPRRALKWSVALLFVLAACTADPPPPPPPPPTSAEPACPPSGVTVAPGLSEAVMGLRVLNLELTNCGTEPYELNGFPGIRVLDEDGEVLAVEVGEGSSGIATVPEFDAAPAPVTVAPGRLATTGIMWKNTTTEGVAQLGATLEIRPKPGAPWQRVVSDDLHIDLGTTGKLGVRPWK